MIGKLRQPESLIMADQEKSQNSKGGMGQKPQRDDAGQRSKPPAGGTVGRDVPDHSKERNTEIAVEAGRTGGEHPSDKR